MLVSRFMTRRPVTVAPTATLDEAIRLMEQHGFRHLPVVADGAVVGILSDRDVPLGTGAARTSLAPGRVDERMRTPAFCVEGDERGPVAALRMIEQHIGALPVLQGGRLAGLVTETNLVTAFRDLCRDPARSDELDRSVEEVMHSLAVTLSPKEALEDALRKCGDWRVRHIPVLDENEELAGMVSDRDIRLAVGRAQAGAGNGAGGKPGLVKDVMSGQVVSIDPREPLSRAVTVMLDGRVSALPVLLDGTLLGMITRTDILEHYGSVA